MSTTAAPPVDTTTTTATITTTATTNNGSNDVAKTSAVSKNPAYRDPTKPIIPNVPQPQKALHPTAKRPDPASAQPGTSSGPTPARRRETSRGLGSAFYGVYCKRCGDAEIVEDHREGDLVCGECGLTLQSRMIDDTSEWRSFSNSDHAGADPNRVGYATNTLLETSGTSLSTSIQLVGVGEAITSRLANHQHELAGNKDEKLNRIQYAKISDLCTSMTLPTTVEESAKLVYKRVSTVRAVKQRGYESVVAACVYIACRQHGLSRTLKEVCAHTNVNKRDIGRVYKAILKALGTSLSVIQAKEYIPRFASLLNLPFQTQRAAIHVAEKATDDRRVAGRSPISVAAAALYLVCQASVTELHRTKEEVGKVCGVAEQTITQSYKDILPHVKELFPTFYAPAIPFTALPTN